MYEEMESLQGGVAIPHYYGWFEAELEPTWTVDWRSSENEAPTSIHSGTLAFITHGPNQPRGQRCAQCEQRGAGEWAVSTMTEKETLGLLGSRDLLILHGGQRWLLGFHKRR